MELSYQRSEKCAHVKEKPHEAAIDIIREMSVLEAHIYYISVMTEKTNSKRGTYVHIENIEGRYDFGTNIG